MNDGMRNGRLKKVLYLATFDPTVSTTGTTTRGKLFLDFFSRHYEVHLVHLEEKHPEGRDHDLVQRVEDIISIPYTALEYFIYSRKMLQAARAKLETGDFAFIFADFEKAGWYAYLLARQFGLPYVYNSHNVEYQRYLDFARRSVLRYPFVPYMYALERTAARNALLTVAISEQDAKAFRAWIPDERLMVLPGAFDEEQYNPFYEPVKTEKPVVLMVGNYSIPGNRDGVYTLYEKIIPEVVQQRPEVVFRCVGKGFPEDIQHPNLEAAGFVDDLREEYRRAALVIVPISIGGGIKIKAIEGLASGKQMIMTPKGAEGIQTNGLKNVTVTDLENFGACILTALEHPQLKTVDNWDKVRHGYGVRSQLEDLRQRIEDMLPTAGVDS
jgi:glycosyltransferase involved in cell wall biosynthesis